MSFKKKQKKPSNNDSTSTKDDSPFFVGKGQGGSLPLSLIRQKLITKDTEMSVADPCFLLLSVNKEPGRPKNKKHSKTNTHDDGSSHTTEPSFTPL